MKPRLHTKYEEEVLPTLKSELGRDNPHALPKLKKIVLSMGLGEASRDSKLIDQAQDMLSIIAGQKSARRKATKSISQFRLREGTEVGVMVTLRGARMYEFLDRLVALALPRVRDFRGLNPKAFDGAGNFNMGLNEQYVFPEVDPDRFPNVQGLNIVMVTTARNDAEGRLLMRELGLPLQKPGEEEARRRKKRAAAAPEKKAVVKKAAAKPAAKKAVKKAAAKKK